MAKNHSLDQGRLKLLVLIVNRSKGEFYADLLQQFEINFQISCLAIGTASKEIQQLIGLNNNEKTAIFAVVREDQEEAALNTLEDKFATIRDGKGIAYTIPFNSLIGSANYSFLSNHRKGLGESI